MSYHCFLYGHAAKYCSYFGGCPYFFAAKSFGLANAWIDCQRLSESGSWGATAKVEEQPQFDFQYFSMEEMAQAVAQELV